MKKIKEKKFNADKAEISGCNLNHLTEPLLMDGYKKVGEWYVDGDFKIKFNKRNITLKSAKGTQLIYANPKEINENTLAEIVQRAMV